MSPTRTVALDISALDPEFRSHAHRGIGRYVKELSKALLETQSSIAREKNLNIQSFSHKTIEQSSGKALQLLGKAVEYSPACKMTLRQQLVQPLKLSSLAKSFTPPADLLHFPAHMDAPAFANQDTCVTVLDLIPLVLSDLYKAANPSWRFHFARFLEKRAIQRASLILCISECTARDTARLLAVDEEKIFVTPLAVDTSLFTEQPPGKITETKQKLGITKKYFLYVGGIDPRKNIARLLRAYDTLAESCKEKNQEIPLLVLAGKIKEDREYPKLLEKIKTLKHRETILEVGFVTDVDLSVLYSEAIGFVFPSLYEGFGFPILEAFAARCPVICSNNSSLPEVAGDAALTIDPENIVSITQAMERLLCISEEMRQEYIERGKKRVRLFSWQQTAYKTIEAYERYFSRK